jgi:hypothetical protein
MWKDGERILWVFFIRALIPSMRPPKHPSTIRWRLRISTYELQWVGCKHAVHCRRQCKTSEEV